MDGGSLDFGAAPERCLGQLFEPLVHEASMGLLEVGIRLAAGLLHMEFVKPGAADVQDWVGLAPVLLVNAAAGQVGLK